MPRVPPDQMLDNRRPVRITWSTFRKKINTHSRVALRTIVFLRKGSRITILSRRPLQFPPTILRFVSLRNCEKSRRTISPSGRHTYRMFFFLIYIRLWIFLKTFNTRTFIKYTVMFPIVFAARRNNNDVTCRSRTWLNVRRQ